jgi:purine nucleosidase
MARVALPDQQLIIDSDGGVDDALCVALAAQLLSPEQLTLASVFGNVEVAQASSNLALLAQLSGIEGAVIWEGAAQALDGFAETATEVHGDDGLGGVSAATSVLPRQVRPLGELLANLEQRRGAYKLLAIGPATNIPVMIEALGGQISEITLMSGSVFDVGNVTPAAEFNAFNDPAALNEVVRSGLPVRIVPLDLCRKVIFERANLPCLKKLGRISDVLIPAHEHYMTGYREWDGIDGCFPHDSIALLVSLFPDRFYSLGLDVEAETVGENRGRLNARRINPESQTRVFLGGDLKWVRALFNSALSLDDWLGGGASGAA